MTLQYSNAIGAAILFVALALVHGEVRTARAETTTECTINKFCYCVNSSLKNTIEKQVVYIGRQIREQKAQGKAIGYMSIPISTGEGSYFGVNAKVAAEVAERVADHFGVRSFWILNPARKDFALPSGASGAEYMLMWTKVLEGEDGLGSDFDFVYFVGPSDFAKYFSLDGHADMEKLDAYYEGLAATDPGIKTVDKKQFRNYYTLRASVTYSLGSHDEWNIVRAISEKRRQSDSKIGIVKQLSAWFDGRALPPGAFESPITAGNAGNCAKN